MKISYYVSPRFWSNKGLPFWILPLVLFILLGIVLVWSLFSLQYDSSTRSFEGIQSSLREQPKDITSYYYSAVSDFREHSYYSAGRKFQSIVKSPQVPLPLKHKALLYYAFSLLLYGEAHKDTNLIQVSRGAFERLIRTVANQSPLYFRAMWGHARATRYLNTDYLPKTGLVLLDFSRQTTSNNLKRSLYLELGYYYFALNDTQKSSDFFRRSGLLVDSLGFYEDALNKSGSEPILLFLLKNHQISDSVIYTYGSSLTKKFLSWAVRYINIGQYNQAQSILSILMQNFRSEEALEDIYFFSGYLAQQKGRLRDAVSHYQRVVSNGYLDKDPAAYFNMAVIYWNSGRKETAYQYLELVSSQFSDTYYGIQAQKWLDSISRRLPNGNSQMILGTPKTTFRQPVIAPRDLVTDFSHSMPVGSMRRERNRLVSREGEETTNTQKPPIVNVNIDQRRSVTSTTNSNNANLSKIERNARNSTYSPRNDGSNNTVTSLKRENPPSPVPPISIVEPSLEKDFESVYTAPEPQGLGSSDDTIWFESRRDTEVNPDDLDSNISSTQDELSRDFDGLGGNTAVRAN